LAKRRIVDLHLHSSASDGTDSPKELVAVAERAGVTTMALMDHDVLDGVEDARTAAIAAGITLISGTELSVQHGDAKMHMLVYFLEPTAGPLQDKLGWLRQGRNERNLAIIENLNRAGYTITIDDVRAKAAGRSIGRPHIADALVERGYFDHRDAAFVDLLGDGGAVYVERERFKAEEAIELARTSGAVPVIAHPYTIRAGHQEYTRIFKDLTNAGLGGIEAHHSAHAPELRIRLTEIAHALGLAATGGSDYHGAGKRDYGVGVGKGDLRVPPSAVDELEAQRGQ